MVQFVTVASWLESEETLWGGVSNRPPSRNVLFLTNKQWIANFSADGHFNRKISKRQEGKYMIQKAILPSLEVRWKWSCCLHSWFVATTTRRSKYCMLYGITMCMKERASLAQWESSSHGLWTTQVTSKRHFRVYICKDFEWNWWLKFINPESFSEIFVFLLTHTLRSTHTSSNYDSWQENTTTVVRSRNLTPQLSWTPEASLAERTFQEKLRSRNKLHLLLWDTPSTFNQVSVVGCHVFFLVTTGHHIPFGEGDFLSLPIHNLHSKLHEEFQDFIKMIEADKERLWSIIPFLPEGLVNISAKMLWRKIAES